MKSALDLLKNRVLAKSNDSELESHLNEIKVTYQTVLDVYEAKHGSKIAGTLRSQPR